MFVSKWARWYRVLRNGNTLSFIGAIRYSLWLARH